MMWLGNDLLKSTNLKRSWWDVAECWMISQTGWNPPNLQQWKCSLSPIQLLSLHSSPILELQTQSQSRGIYFVQIYWAPFSNLSAPALFFLPKCAPQKIRPEFPIEEDLLYNSQHFIHSNLFFCLFISKILHSYYIHWLSNLKTRYLSYLFGLTVLSTNLTSELQSDPTADQRFNQTNVQRYDFRFGLLKC